MEAIPFCLSNILKSTSRVKDETIYLHSLSNYRLTFSYAHYSAYYFLAASFHTLMSVLAIPRHGTVNARSVS